MRFRLIWPWEFRVKVRTDPDAGALYLTHAWPWRLREMVKRYREATKGVGL